MSAEKNFKHSMKLNLLNMANTTYVCDVCVSFFIYIFASIIIMFPLQILRISFKIAFLQRRVMILICIGQFSRNRGKNSNLQYLDNENTVPMHKLSIV